MKLITEIHRIKVQENSLRSPIDPPTILKKEARETVESPSRHGMYLDYMKTPTNWYLAVQSENQFAGMLLL